MSTKVALGSVLFVSSLYLFAPSSSAQVGTNSEVEARQACWMRVLGSTEKSITTAEDYQSIRACVKERLGREDPYMVAMQSRWSVKPSTAGKVVLNESVAGFCYATANGVQLSFSVGGSGRYTEGSTTYAFSWKQDGAQVQFTTPGGNTFYFRHTTKHGVPSLMKGLPDGREAGPYVRGKC